MPHAPIPFVDLRGKTPVDLLRAYPDRARDLVRASRKSWGIWSDAASVVALPVADALSRHWLKRQNNPYLYEIESIADVLRKPGGYALNVCFEWGCSSGVWSTGETVSLLRVLDWPFPGLGQYTLVALQSGKAGIFYNITWPGMAGVFNAMAPGRFSAAINQAPMRRHQLTFPGDWIKNRIGMRGQMGIPPAHLLRQVCENAKTYAEAKEALAKTPIAIPAIFVLAGVVSGEGCIIERLENDVEIIELREKSHIVSANHFVTRLDGVGKGWRPREIDSVGRYRYCNGLDAHELDVPHFGWLKAPVINAKTRLSMLADATGTRLMVQGYEGIVPATRIFHMSGISHEWQRAV
jgi:hypothetical protein